MIGVIGANGVAATNRLCTLIEEKLTRKGAFRDAHHPEMIIWQATMVPSRSMYLEGRGPSFIDDYVKIGQSLKQLGCNLLCMCCNTAHYAIDELESKIGLPFINIIDEVAKAVSSRGVEKVGIMCGDGCRLTNLYDKSFSRICNDVQIIYPDEEHQRLVTKGICNSKNSKRFLDSRDEESPYNCFHKTFEYLISKGCNLVISGCTDINNVYGEGNFLIVDSLDILADTIVETHLKHFSDEKIQ